MTVHRFTGPSTTRRHTGKCPRCGKRVTRSRSFEMTVNPFNKNKETGVPKTWDEVDADVEAEADAWVPDFRHEACTFLDQVDAMNVDELTKSLAAAQRDLEVYAHYKKHMATLRADIATYEARLAVLAATPLTTGPS